jgi:hypothetical protein
MSSVEQIVILAIVLVAMVIATTVLVWRAYKRRHTSDPQSVRNLNLAMERGGRHVKPSAAVPSSLNRRPSTRATNNLTVGVLAASASDTSTSSD